MWRFQIYQDRGMQFRWRLRAPNGLVIADSGEGGYTTRSNAKRAAENVRARIAQALVEDV